MDNIYKKYRRTKNMVSSNVNKDTVLITGGAGMIGSNLVKKLLENENNHIIVLDNFSNDQAIISGTFSLGIIVILVFVGCMNMNKHSHLQSHLHNHGKTAEHLPI